MVVEVGARTARTGGRGAAHPHRQPLPPDTRDRRARRGWSEDVRQGILENLEAAFEEAERELEMGRVRGWVHWRGVYLAQLERAVRAEGFAMPGAELAQTEARFAGEWQGFEVVGRVDRIDRTPEGLVFVDYKSTASAPKPDLQLSVYREAAAPALFPGEPVRGRLLLLLEAGRTHQGQGAQRGGPREHGRGDEGQPRGGALAARRPAAGLRLLRVRPGVP